jgi:hypothetical protein
MKKLKAKFVEPLDYILSRPEPIAAEFAARFIRFHETGDEAAFDRAATIAMTAHMAAKHYEKELSQDDRALTNAFVYLANGLTRGTAEEEPVAEPTAAPTPQTEGAK